MKFISQIIPEIILIEPIVQEDHRGYFFETFKKKLLEEKVGYSLNFVQENESKSTKGVLRGLHYQIPPYTQAKLVRVVNGKVLVVAVDIRKSSKTFGRYVSVEITSNNKQQLFIPHGFAHGFVVLSDIAIFNYKVDNYYAPKFERGIAFNDKNLSINWKIPSEFLILSEKDKIQPSMANTDEFFD